MGQTASTPKPGTQIQVIGAGLPRTGTASFSTALTILLNDPVYHGGTQLTRGPPSELKTWICILRAWLGGDKPTVLSLIKDRLDGYAAITDAPGCQLLPELLELYPDAKVICTVRDPIAWEKSMNQIHGFAHFTWLLRQQWSNLYADGRRFSSVKEVSDTLPQRAIYSKHVAWLQENVPADRLVFFDVREGWEPLCKALGKDVPTDIPFPHVNDSEGIARTAKYHIRHALIRWVAISAISGIAIIGFIRRW
ncbi:NAD dependent epimerase/dehydratase [Aspergillus arachidicola]|uniref:NAD dependent epimerase/dehydratase n=1 Tax=Aspergillus arachidicola TaxID=656916 RepID=A0A2G7FQR7_9EURO|nr:NAD dependent epimerase/dehydratase [Aspergillus arachidicola]